MDVPQENPSDGNGRYRGFSLERVSWGYRDVFAQAIDGLFQDGWLGPDREQVTERFFDLLKCSEQRGVDHVVKEFLDALHPQTCWIMDLPGIFTDVVDLGRTFADDKIYRGIAYFKTLGEGGFGDTPERVRNLMNYLRRLREIDDDLALAFLSGYRHLSERLVPVEIEQYIDQGRKMFETDQKRGRDFMAGVLKSSENVILSLTGECRLSDVEGQLTPLLRALVGYEVEVDNLGALDSDELIERGSTMVCMYRWLYVPARIRHFADAAQNRNIYILMAVVAAGMLAEDSFPRIHGHPEFERCTDLVGHDPLRLNLFQIIEYVRVLRRIKTRWPGAKGLLDFGLQTEFKAMSPATPADRIFYDVMMSDGTATTSTEKVKRLAHTSVNCFHTASLLDGDWTSDVLSAYPGLDRYPLRTFTFLPDFLYPATVSAAPKDSLIADLKQAASERIATDDDGESESGDTRKQTAGAGVEADDNDKEEAEGVAACYVYDEWSQSENDYYCDYCFVHERRPNEAARRAIPPELTDKVQQIRRVFERLKPDMVRREKYLTEGDYINPDLVLEYLVQRRREPSPKVNFYEKPLVNRRDLAVLIVLDLSGSTGEDVEEEKVIEVEKDAAIILGEGLASLDDRFAVCGFSGNGRENCEYVVFKSFEDNWDDAARGRLLAAYPMSSTRIGPALRHSGFMLSQVAAKQRLIILITDGKPMDAGYDPTTRYAQYDVRKACEENRRQCIHTFCISTDENSRADMEIMMPERRFVILPDIRDLPRVLPKLYVKMTV